MAKEINMFVIYAREDKDIKLDLLRHLNPFKEAFNLSIWHDDQIEPGQMWKPHIESRLNFTDVFLLLVSVDFMNSEFIRQTEFKAAIDRHKENKSVVIPVIIDYCQWDIDFTLIDYKFNINELQVLPDEGKPVGDWNSPDQAYNNIAAGVRKVLTSIQNKRKQEAKEEKNIAKSKEAEEKRLADEAETKRKAEEDQGLKAEAEAKKKAEEEAARKKAEEEKRLADEAEAKRKAEEDQRLKEQAEAKKKAEEEAARKKAEEEKRLAAEIETKRKAEEEQRLKAEAEAKKKAEEEAAGRNKAKEEKRLADEAEAKRRAEEVKKQSAATDATKSQTSSPTYKNKKSKLLKPAIIAVVLIITVVIIINPFKKQDSRSDSISKLDSIAWDKTQTKVRTLDSISAKIAIYEDYKYEFPNGIFTVNANTLIDSLNLEQAKIDSIKKIDEAFAKLEVGGLYLDEKSFVIEVDHDNKTGKMAGSTDSGPMPWQKAMNIHEELGEGWRLPTLEELKLMREKIGQNAENQGNFKNELYWSSETAGDDNGQAYLLDFGDGYRYSRNKLSNRKLRAIKNFSR